MFFSLLHCLYLLSFAFGPISAAHEEQVVEKTNHLQSPHWKSLQSKLELLSNEAKHLSSNIKDNFGQNDLIDHMMESFAQAEDSLRQIVENNIQVDSPVIGAQAKRHIVREVVSTILQIVGLYGVTVTFGSMVYSFLGGLIVSGGFLSTSFAFLPFLFSSALAFPPMLLLIEAFFGLSFIVGSFSWIGLTTLIDGFGFLLLNPQILEQIGIFTLIMGLISSLLL
jgi:hypothetical protein